MRTKERPPDVGCGSEELTLLWGGDGEGHGVHCLCLKEKMGGCLSVKEEIKYKPNLDVGVFCLWTRVCILGSLQLFSVVLMELNACQGHKKTFAPFC